MSAWIWQNLASFTFVGFLHYHLPSSCRHPLRMSPMLWCREICYAVFGIFIVYTSFIFTIMCSFSLDVCVNLLRYYFVLCLVQNKLHAKWDCHQVTDWVTNFSKLWYVKHYWWLAELICKKVFDDFASFNCWYFNTLKVFVC